MKRYRMLYNWTPGNDRPIVHRVFRCQAETPDEAADRFREWRDARNDELCNGQEVGNGHFQTLEEVR